MSLILQCDQCPERMILSSRSVAVPANWSKIKMTVHSVQELRHLCPRCTAGYNRTQQAPSQYQPPERGPENFAIRPEHRQGHFPFRGGNVLPIHHRRGGR